MKLFLSFLILPLLISSSLWINNLEKAEQVAHDEHKLILLNFSGSDWCGPCIRMHHEIFDSEDFRQYANDNLVMTNADFPRMKKNQLSKDQQKLNDQLADKYNADGTFPCTLLLDSDGKIIYTWKGFYSKGAEAFSSEVRHQVDTYRKK